MREPDVIELNNCDTLQVVGYPVFFIQAMCDKCGRTADLIIKTDHRNVAELKEFTSCVPLDKERKVFPAILEYFAGNTQRPFLFLFGIFEIWFIIPSANKAIKVARLHRNISEDRGFYHLFIHEYADFFLVRYESGVCKITYDGTLVWHSSMKWDDIFIRQETNYLIYNSEYLNGGKDWKLDLKDGQILLFGDKGGK